MINWAAHEQSAKVVAAYGSLLIPLFIGLATCSVNEQGQVRSAAESCREKSLKLYDDASAAADKLQQLGNAAPSIKADITRRQSVALELLTGSCDQGRIKIPQGVTDVITRLSSFAPEASVKQSLEQSAQRASSDTPAPTATSSQGAPGGIARVFLQISDESQRPAAHALADALKGKLLAGHPITIPGIELVSPQPTSSVRCLKRSDCSNSAQLVTLTRSVFPRLQLQIYDLSSRYEGQADVKVGTYEIWFGQSADLTAREPS